MVFGDLLIGAVRGAASTRDKTWGRFGFKGAGTDAYFLLGAPARFPTCQHDRIEDIDDGILGVGLSLTDEDDFSFRQITPDNRGDGPLNFVNLEVDETAHGALCPFHGVLGGNMGDVHGAIQEGLENVPESANDCGLLAGAFDWVLVGPLKWDDLGGILLG